MKKYIEKQFESGEKYIESTSQGYPIWWREFEGIVNEANTLSDLNRRLVDSKTPFGLLPKSVANITVFNPFFFDFLTDNPNYLQCFYDGHKKGEKEFKKTYFIKYPDERQIKVITRKFNDDFKNTILLGESFFNESNVTMAGFENGILTAYWLFENSFLKNQHLQTEAAPLLEDLPPQQSTKYDLGENTEPNNLTTSTIEDWLFEFKERNILTAPNYTTLVNALAHYFENGTFPKVNQTIKVGRVNKKLLGWHLNRIFHSEGKGVEIDLLRFAKANISTFKDVEFDEKDIQNSNLYKYFTTKTK